MTRRKELTDLNTAIRALALELHQRGETSPAEFVSLFRERYPDLVDLYQPYGFDAFLKDKSRLTMKRLGRSIEKAYEAPAPMLFSDQELPSVLPVRRVVNSHTEPVWVSRREGGFEEGEEFGRMLRLNAKGCFDRLADWFSYWSKIKPLLKENPSWTIGDAEDRLATKPPDEEAA